MKEQKYKKIILCLVFIFVFMMMAEIDNVSAKSVAKNKVTITSGTKKKIKIKVSKIKKLKVKSSKKSVATVKTVGKKAIRITGKKSGKAVITVKATTKKGKVKKIQYKVTVKKKSKKKSQDKNNTNNSADKKPANNQIKQPIIKPKYKYELQVMNSKDKNLYNDSDVVIYIKTNNPNPVTIKADCGTGKLVKREDEDGVFYTIEDEFHKIISSNVYSDVRYTGSNNQVSGGYLYTYKWDNPGKKNFTIKEKAGETWIAAASIEIELKDKKKSENEWLQSVINEVIDSSMTSREKMQRLKQYILDNFMYDRNNEQGGIYLLADEGVYWERKHIDCWDATNIMCLFAEKLGLKSKWTYAGYAQHYYATVTIDGKEYEYDACPMSETGWTIVWEYIL